MNNQLLQAIVKVLITCTNVLRIKGFNFLLTMLNILQKLGEDVINISILFITLIYRF